MSTPTLGREPQHLRAKEGGSSNLIGDYMIKCGLCGKIKTKQNHWWTLVWNLTLRSTFTFPMEAELTDSHDVPMDNEAHYCGIECLSKAESMVRSGENPVREIPE